MIKKILKRISKILNRWYDHRMAGFDATWDHSAVAGPDQSFMLQCCLFLARKYADPFDAMWYVWNTNGARGTADCSGFIVFLFRILRIFKRKEDYTCQGISEMWPSIEQPKAGALVFYGSPKRATHVMLCLDNQWCIGATGGNSKCTTVKKAMEIDARVKIELIKYRGDIKRYVWPWDSV